MTGDSDKYIYFKKELHIETKCIFKWYAQCTYPIVCCHMQHDIALINEKRRPHKITQVAARRCKSRHIVIGVLDRRTFNSAHTQTPLFIVTAPQNALSTLKLMSINLHIHKRNTAKCEVNAAETQSHRSIYNLFSIVHSISTLYAAKQASQTFHLTYQIVSTGVSL